MSAFHLCIDMQVGEKEDIVIDWSDLSEKVRYTITELSSVNIPTVYVALARKVQERLIPYPRAKELLLGPDAFAFDVPETATVAIKNYFSAYRCDPLRIHFQSLSVKDIILSGVLESGRDGEDFEGSCVSMTAKEFHKVGYQATIVAGATNLSRTMALKERQKLHGKYGIEIKPLDEIIKKYRPGSMARANIGIT